MVLPAISRAAVMAVGLALAIFGVVGCATEDDECCWPTGAVGTRYAEVPGPTGPLGDCTGDERDRDGGRQQDFEQGAIYWTPDTGAWEVYGQIGDEYENMGGPTSALGWPVSGELPTPDGVGRFNRFQHGNIYHSPAGTYPVYGAIFDAYAQQGYENGRLGFPTSGEQDTDEGRRGNFQGGWIEWNSSTGAITVG
ncbi:trehalose corynomycolyl transferase [Nocardia otitidiscaviarum]|uniref:LGFP repeat-containing protein n=1 Tax=Nocardia otitidiscaviarum TaxID=1823 RepID=UPI0018940597|nr:trehalose corynomycolyl transferase [Nocardia otitidiscaviarum]MBF6241509.1 trehalose corynomycolyl transferase [Nocardia otitidiscaviarum]